MDIVKDRRGSESPLAHRPTPTTPTDQQAPAPHIGPELETIMGLLTG